MSVSGVRWWLAVGCLALLGGCTAGGWQRLGYETLQNLAAQQCAADRSGRCAPRQSFDAYQRARSGGDPAG